MTNALRASAIIAEDEFVLRAELMHALKQLWPELNVVAEAPDGITAAKQIADLHPDVAFLDVRMPGLSGIEVARVAAGKTHVVFLTAYDEYAVNAFDHGAVDYLLKPLDIARLAVCIQRIKARLTQRPADLSGLQAHPPYQPHRPERLSWIQASSGSQLRFINVNDVRCFRADAKYTRVVTAGFEAHIRTPIKELMASLDAEKFWQISRSAIVSVAAIDAVQRADGGLVLRLGGDAEWLNVSQAFQHQFRQM
ncbi:LytR/AlgR family response regulator transcription factor [Undibacterium sp.]|uniref:LytR/AlgR family response regulator transcription factor n=1 Tax=Undibacterium sp. TaxID=1914977 RepID=UPI00374D3386